MNRRILIIEDNPANLELMRYLLSCHGCHVSTATDGREGLEKVRAELPDLVICDIQLPGMDGLEVIRATRQDPGLAGIPMVAVTAYAMDEDRKKIAGAGFDGYFAKPIDPVTFVDDILGYIQSGEVH